MAQGRQASSARPNDNQAIAIAIDVARGYSIASAASIGLARIARVVVNRSGRSDADK
ncbi:hypothetical protein BCR44DRAFT_38428 [Catenaria anguillulae PL171]|uniref:Uncharacterized protein n=1 Tax=Catenaria anguillulae PL171 TaxID=765915 RepID=A0A1Y2HPA5_9FUNG|nr:hypothetical protein BCR44DRAFT_38428 [Catenaria anguillulae PL171]